MHALGRLFCPATVVAANAVAQLKTCRKTKCGRKAKNSTKTKGSRRKLSVAGKQRGAGKLTLRVVVRVGP